MNEPKDHLLWDEHYHYCPACDDGHLCADRACHPIGSIPGIYRSRYCEASAAIRKATEGGAA